MESMFEGDFSDTCFAQFPLKFMGTERPTLAFGDPISNLPEKSAGDSSHWNHLNITFKEKWWDEGYIGQYRKDPNYIGLFVLKLYVIFKLRFHSVVKFYFPMHFVH